MTDVFDYYMFTSNATNFVCPGWLLGHYNWTCPPPSACATDSRTTRQYCCGGSGFCWNPSWICAGDGSTFTCKSGGYTWCCLTNKEICTQMPGQINICLNLDHNTVNNISSSVLNENYSSLSSAQPLASSYTFDPLALIAQTQTTSTQMATATTSAGCPSDNTCPNSLPGSAIAGIVIGVVAAIVITALVTFLLMRYRQKKQNGLAQATITQADLEYTQPAQQHHRYSEPITLQELPTKP